MIDDTRYFLRAAWSDGGALAELGRHRLEITAKDRDAMSLSVAFAPTEDRSVSTLRQIDHDFIVLPFFPVVAIEPFSETTGLDSDDRIGAWIERGLASEDLDSDRIFLEVVRLALEHLARDERDEVLEPVRRSERGTRRNAFDLLAYFPLVGRGHGRLERRVHGQTARVYRPDLSS